MAHNSVTELFEQANHLKGKPIHYTLSPDLEAGQWLQVGWHKAENGGSDGRWVQLFPDVKVGGNTTNR